MQFEKPVLLYGAGKEAQSTRAFLLQQDPNLKVFVCVDSGDANIPNAEILRPSALEQAIDERRFATIIKSPGVSLYKPIFEKARAAGIDITSNVNLWGANFAKGRTVIAITGPTGKSTTATLTFQMLKDAGIDVGLAGNVGVPPLDIADKHKVVVLELSSYQTADMNFAPDLVGFTNLFPEHVDWHGSAQKYYADKLHLLDIAPTAPRALGSQAAANPIVQAHVADIRTVLPPIPLELEDEIQSTAPRSALKGQHNIDNAKIAAQLALASGAHDDAVISAIKNFSPLPHRLEEHKIGDYLIVDDSISTTPEATKAALSAYAGHKIALLAGGFDRDQDYDDLGREIYNAGVSLLICLPTTGGRIAASAKKHAPYTTVIEVDTLEAAMDSLFLRKSHFETIILSPGAPSYNQYKNFKQRGEAFIQLARHKFAP